MMTSKPACRPLSRTFHPAVLRCSEFSVDHIGYFVSAYIFFPLNTANIAALILDGLAHSSSSASFFLGITVLLHVCDAAVTHARFLLPLTKLTLRALNFGTFFTRIRESC